MNADTDPVMPGAWVCDRCDFQLQLNVLHAGNGAMSADTSPLNQTCPNDGQLMRPLTWREVNRQLFVALVLERRRLHWLDHHCSFVADTEYCLGPFQVGELRQLADAGLAADDAKRAPRGPDV